MAHAFDVVHCFILRTRKRGSSVACPAGARGACQEAPSTRWRMTAPNGGTQIRRDCGEAPHRHTCRGRARRAARFAVTRGCRARGTSILSMHTRRDVPRDSTILVRGTATPRRRGSFLKHRRLRLSPALRRELSGQVKRSDLSVELPTSSATALRVNYKGIAR